MADEPDNESGVRGYLPPSGPQNVHRVPYEFRENQGAHSVGSYVIESPEEIIVTADPDAIRQFDSMNLESIPDDDAQKVLDAMSEGDDATIASIVEGSEGSEDSDTSESSDDEIPEDLDSLGYRDLQDLAQKHNIRATQSTEELRTALSSVRAGDGIPDEIDTADESEGSEDSDTSEGSEGSESQEFSAYEGR